MSGIIGLFLTFITISILSQSDASSFTKKTRSLSYRLPNNLYPEYYRLDIITNLGDLNENFTFTGRVGIKVCISGSPKAFSTILNSFTIVCRYGTNKIILHSKDLKVMKSQVTVLGSEYMTDDDVQKLISCESNCPNGVYRPQILSQSFVPEFDFYIITLADDLKPGHYYLVNIPYEGELSHDLAGFYRSSYRDEKGFKRWLGVTQFESTDARRALPCFDEPIFKSKFQINIGHINTRKSISNMPLSSTYPIKQMENWVWDQFEVTPPMSVYLLAFVVFDSSFTKASDKCGITSVYARKAAISQVQYVCHIAPRILDYFEQYFDIKYALPKLQMVAVPDFNSAGMENWGLITYRETALLYDPRVSTRSNQFYVASVVAHEIAHQWFGNLVTMKWWTDLWLNEGFATYISGFGVHHITEEVDFLEEEIVDNAMSVFAFDSSVTSHPISVPIGNPSEIAQIFDTISYKKGSFALRMLHSILGEDAFRRGLSKYLKKYAYNNAGQDDLWEVLTEEAHHAKALPSKITIKKVMDSWTLQTGYPVVTVRRDYEKGMALVTQERFVIYPEYLENSEAFNGTWWIPLSYTSANESDFNSTAPRSWIRNKEEEIVILNVPEDQWVIFNIRLSAIYRVNYDLKNWNLLISALIENHHRIGMLNRVHLIDDAFNLAKGRRIKYNIALEILQYLKNETEYFPWRTALKNLGFIDKILRYYPNYEQYRELLVSLISNIYERISKIKYFDTPENLYKIKLQELVASWACKYEIGDCKERALSWFYAWMNSSDPNENNPIPKNLRAHIYCTAIRAGGEKEWDFLWLKYLMSNVGDEKSLLLMSLTCTRDVRLLYRYLNWSLNETNGIRKQDSGTVFSGVARNEIGYFLAKNFLMSRLDDIYKFYGPNSTRIGNYISVVGNQITLQNDLIEFQNLINKNQHILSQSQLVVDQALYNAAINVWLGKEVSAEFQEYFDCANKKTCYWKILITEI